MLRPILQTAPGPDFHKPAITRDSETGQIVKEYTTNNPIPEGEIFTALYKGKMYKFQVDMSFYTDPNLVVMRIIK